MNISINKLLSLVGVVGFLAILLAINFYPEIPNTFASWAALIFLGLPAWVVIEWLGSSVLQSHFFIKLSSGVRVLIGVPATIVLFGVVYFIGAIVHQTVASISG